MDKYPHLSFRANWRLPEHSKILLAKCDATLAMLCNLPLLPGDQELLAKVSLVKGAQATTAIENNTLSEDAVQAILEDKSQVPPSQQYMEQEVRNVLGAMNDIRKQLKDSPQRALVSPELLLAFHRQIGKDLGEHFQAIPGRFRNRNVTVGAYKCPDSEDVLKLVDQLCEFLKTHFNYQSGRGGYSFSDAIVQAICAHVYLEWIHPFGDGNGRTGRLLEFYILLRAGMPFYTSHILSNHYNLTRSSYYLYLHKATEQRDLGVFLAYAIQGLYDGLQLALQTVVESIQKITWTQHIYTHLKASANRKPRLLALLNELGNHLNKAHTPAELELLSPLVARAYSKSHKSILSGDLKLLCEQSFLVHEGPKYRVNAELFLANYLP